MAREGGRLGRHLAAVRRWWRRTASYRGAGIARPRGLARLAVLPMPPRGFRVVCRWIAAPGPRTAMAATAAHIRVLVGPHNLTANLCIWSETVRPEIAASAYPLAAWFVEAWWRLHYEPLPAPYVAVGRDWRVAHELAATFRGFSWPKVLWCSDGALMQVWAVATPSSRRQAVRYLSDTGGPVALDLADFTAGLDAFMAVVARRLNVCGRDRDALLARWAAVQADRADREACCYRRLEAQLGYGTGQCAPGLMALVRGLVAPMGPAAGELVPAYGKAAGLAIGDLETAVDRAGEGGAPQDPCRGVREAVPRKGWGEQGVLWARGLRRAIGEAARPLDDARLCGLLGITLPQALRLAKPNPRAFLGIPAPGGTYRLLFRAGDRLALRWEWARLYGDFLLPERVRGGWLVGTDLPTWRQKFQTAFAGELLCPAQALTAFLGGSLDAASLADAARHFGVCGEVVRAALDRAGLISPTRHGRATGFPYGAQSGPARPRARRSV